MSGKNFDDVIKRKLAKLEEIRQERKQLEVLKSARDAEKAKEKYIEKIKSFVLVLRMLLYVGKNKYL